MTIKKTIVFFLLATMQLFCHAQTITFSSLIKEMSDRSALARFPFPEYASLQASSYNRESTERGKPGWFADSDGTGYIRTEENNGKQEWVIMEHQGAGVITKMWAPYFYYGGLDDMEGPIVNIYLDGASTPVISENYFKLITGRGSVPPPFARVTARAGDCYLPIPYSKSCKITFNKKPFYNIINYRSYPAGTKVKTFTKQDLFSNYTLLDNAAALLGKTANTVSGAILNQKKVLGAGEEVTLKANSGGAINQLELWLDPEEIAANPDLLRSVVFTAEFDGKQTIWSPIGDFFGSANAINPFQTWTRSASSAGRMLCTWVMPFQKTAIIRVKNLSKKSLHINKLAIEVGKWKWDSRSMYFHAGWNGDEILKGSVFVDKNFIDIKGKGVVVGDALTVLNPDFGWWGEGDEKIYTDGEYEKGFPGRFGTGTEDYYGWAGGENPSKDDVFSHPFLANIVVGSATPRRRDVRGFNICTRIRSLDAIPFHTRLVFDMEASPGVDIRNPWDFLGYSTIVFWYGKAGATSNRGEADDAARKPIMTLKTIDSLSHQVKLSMHKE